ncbi:MAG: SDR family NAD(P)-dependent oxidoreductase, partial [Acidimicrobiia bacterium]
MDSRPMGPLAGKHIAVTGSSRGLGRAIAVALATAGSDVVINGTNPTALAETEEMVRATGARCAAVLGSVADDSVAEQLVSVCVERFGGIDVAVNNAAVVRDRTLLKMTPEEFDEVIAVDLRGTWSVSRHAAKAMVAAQQPGLLLQVTSAAAMIGSVGQTNYAAAKAGQLGMMCAWDLELAKYDIRVNAVTPAVATDMTEVIFAAARARAAAKGNPAPTARQLGFASPEEAASLFVFLCSDSAAHIRSQIIQFDGQYLALWQ